MTLIVDELTDWWMTQIMKVMMVMMVMMMMMDGGWWMAGDGRWTMDEG